MTEFENFRCPESGGGGNKEMSMLGAIAGDIAGSVYEFDSWGGDWKDIPLFTSKCFFTDDTVLTMAVAEALTKTFGRPEEAGEELVDCIHEYGKRYPDAGYGGRFASWLGLSKREPYNSFGNGSAMRVSPVAWIYDSLEEVEKYAEISAAVTHNHPEGIKGACAVAGAIFLARKGAGKKEIKDYVSGKYGYNLDRSLGEIKKTYKFDETCQKSVPEAIIAFLESDSFEDSLKKAIWLGGDADTQADIAGAIAEAFFGMPDSFQQEALSRLDNWLYFRYLRWREWLDARK